MASQDSRYCSACGGETLHVKAECISGGIGCLLTILTGGLFLLLWLPLAVIDAMAQPWRCQRCGKTN